MRIKVRAKYEPDDVAKVATRELGTKITGGLIRTLIAECCDTSTVTRYEIAGHLVVRMIEYLKAWYRKPGRLSFGAYLDSVNAPRPAAAEVSRLAQLPVVVPQTRGATDAKRVGAAIEDARVIKLERVVAELSHKVAVLEKSPRPLQLVHRMDSRREAINTKVRNFAITHRAAIDEVWNYLRRTWERLYGIKTEGNLPDWLERTSNLSAFLSDLDTLLQLLADDMVGQQRLAL